MPRTGPGRKVALALALAIVLLLVTASAIVRPGSDTAIVAVSRFGERVRLLPPRPAFSPWPLERRIRFARAGDVAQLIFRSQPGSNGVLVTIPISGSGILPISAAQVRRHGWDSVIGEWLRRIGGPAANALDHRSTEAWKNVFPGDPVASLEPLRVRVAAALRPMEVHTIEARAADSAAFTAAMRAAVAARARHASGRLIVIGLDALDWRLVDELVARGMMPSLGRLIGRGAGAILDVPPPLISPVIWTTLATGHPPEEHGVLDFLERHSGGARPVSSASRRIPAVWEMTAAAGRRSTVIGWWATYPATAEDSLTVYSDRLTAQLTEAEHDGNALAAPERASAIARRVHLAVTAITPAMLAPLLQVDDSELEGVRTGKASWKEPVAGLAKIVASTETTRRLTAHELRNGTSVLLVYLEGTDTIGHLFGNYRPPSRPGVPAGDASRFGPVVDRYYALVDRWLGEIVEGTSDADTIVIVSDHGFTWGSDRPPAASGVQTATAEWWHRPEGFFLAVGPGIEPASRQRMSLLDVAPSLLAIAGVAADATFPGSVPPWLPDGPEARPVNYAALLPRKLVRTTADNAGDQEQLAKLRALGYIGGEPAQGAAGVTTQGNRAEARRLNNLGSSQLAAGKLDAAERSFRKAIASDPSYAASHHNLGLLYRRRGLFDDADRAFWRSVEYGIADREMAVVRLALDYRQRGDAGRALAVFREGQRRFPDSEPIWLNAGVFLGERGQYTEARKSLERAVALNPRNPAAHRNLAAALLALGDEEAARNALRAAGNHE